MWCGSRRWHPSVLSHGGHWNSVAGNVLVVGVIAHLAGAPAGVTRAAAALATALALAVLGLAVIDALRARRDTPAEESVELLAAALRARAPEVLFYYSRPEPIGYIANVWMPTLEQVGRNTVVLVREPHNEPLVETDTIPVVRVTRATDIEVVVPESVRIALYPSNVAKNNHLLRLPGIVDVFVGHGDSDKGGSATVLTRIFDEAWVSGPAARDRYRVADVGVRDEQIREIGRPQLAEITQVAAPLAEDHHGQDASGSWEYTVLYAPTREGFFAEWEYSSVLAQGAVILRTLLDMPGVRVLFKPHPGTGTDDPEFGEEVERLKAMVEAAGPPHEVVTGAEGLYSAFNRADLLVSDISSVITDFLASGKPYVVTSSSGEDPRRFRATFPSAARCLHPRRRRQRHRPLRRGCPHRRHLRRRARPHGPLPARRLRVRPRLAVRPGHRRGRRGRDSAGPSAEGQAVPMRRRGRTVGGRQSVRRAVRSRCRSLSCEDCAVSAARVTAPRGAPLEPSCGHFDGRRAARSQRPEPAPPARPGRHWTEHGTARTPPARKSDRWR